jgi:phosphoribosyl-ATP pyrophosphohydrolase
MKISLQQKVSINLHGCLWPTKEILLKIAEETGELIQAYRKKTADDVEAEVGDVLFAVLAFCIDQDIDAEEALNKAIRTHLSKLSKTWEGDYEAGKLKE